MNPDKRKLSGWENQKRRREKEAAALENTQKIFKYLEKSKIENLLYSKELTSIFVILENEIPAAVEQRDEIENLQQDNLSKGLKKVSFYLI